MSLVLALLNMKPIEPPPGVGRVHYMDDRRNESPALALAADQQAILQLLEGGEEKTIAQLNEGTSLSEDTLRHVLATLKEAKMICEVRRNGPTKHYRACGEQP